MDLTQQIRINLAEYRIVHGSGATVGGVRDVHSAVVLLPVCGVCALRVAAQSNASKRALEFSDTHTFSDTTKHTGGTRTDQGAEIIAQ